MLLFPYEIFTAWLSNSLLQNEPPLLMVIMGWGFVTVYMMAVIRASAMWRNILFTNGKIVVMKATPPSKILCDASQKPPITIHWQSTLFRMLGWIFGTIFTWWIFGSGAVAAFNTLIVSQWQYLTLVGIAIAFHITIIAMIFLIIMILITTADEIGILVQTKHLMLHGLRMRRSQRESLLNLLIALSVFLISVLMSALI